MVGGCPEHKKSRNPYDVFMTKIPGFRARLWTHNLYPLSDSVSYPQTHRPPLAAHLIFASYRAMKLRIFVEITRGIWEPFEFEAADASPGGKLCALLDDVFGRRSQWWVQDTPLDQCTVGLAPLTDGAEISRIPSAASNHHSEIASLEVLHGPDAGTRYPLHRGVYSLGKFQCDLTIADDALEPRHGYLHVLESGFQWQTGQKFEQVTANEHFTVGATTLIISTKGPQPSPTVSVAPVQLDLNPPRSLTLTLVMIGVPLLAGIIVSWLTHNWLFMVMSLVTTVVMGTHLIAQGGSSRKTRQALAQASAKEQDHISAYPSLGAIAQSIGSAPQQYFSLGLHHRPANIRGRNIDRYTIPQQHDILCLLPLHQGLTYLINVDEAVQRSILMQIICTTKYSIAIDETLVQQNPKLHSLYGLRNVEILPTHQHESQADIIWHASARTLKKSAQQSVFRIASNTLEHRIEPATDIIISLQANHRYIQIQQIHEHEEVLVPGLSVDRTLEVCADGISTSAFQTALHTATQSSGTLAHGSDLSPHGRPHRFSSLRDLATETRQQRWHETYYQNELNLHIGLGCESLNATLHGPHFLLGGTTGAGKSQLLRSIILSLAAQYSPRRCSFLLIDFKGSAGLGPLNELPHSLGLLSDFDIAAVKRALAFLTANLKRRESLFAALGISSYRDYVSIRRKTQEPLEFSEIFIVVDEFKMLVESMPEAMTELLKVATIGRSLGVHLVLATQRPQGAISQDIRANIATTIALRVSSEQDSHNLIGGPAASSISASTPGAGYIKTPEASPVAFQAPLIDQVPQLNNDAVSLTNLRTKSGVPKIARSNEHEDQVLQRIVAAYTRGIAEHGSQNLIPAPLVAPLQPEQNQLHAGQLYLGLHENPAAGFIENLIWEPTTHGSLHLVADSALRQSVELSIVQQWSHSDTACTIFTADGNFYRQLKAASPVTHCILGLQDIDFLHEIIDYLLTKNTLPAGIIIDGLDVLLEETMRSPDLQLKLLQLLQDGHRSGISVVTSSHLSLRGKFATAVSNTAIHESSYTQDLSILKPRTEIPPLPHQWKMLGEIVREKLQNDPRSNAVLTVQKADQLCPLSAVLNQLPIVIFDQDIPRTVPANPHDFLLGIDSHSKPVYIRNEGSKFFCIAGKKSSGKTSALSALIALNPHQEFITVDGCKVPSATALKQVLSSVPQSEQKALLIDNLQVLDAQCQNVVINASALFQHVFIAFTSWKRWHSSPLLSKLAGTSKGIVLQPATASDLEIFTMGDLPLTLKTDGALPAGRAIYIESASARAFQVAKCTPISGPAPEAEDCY